VIPVRAQLRAQHDGADPRVGELRRIHFLDQARLDGVHELRPAVPARRVPGRWHRAGGRAVSAATARADALMREAFPLHEAGRLEDAERLYREILALAPEYADAHYLMGVVAQTRGDYAGAVRCLRQALQHRNDEPAFHQTLAQCYLAQRLWEEAAAHFENALRLAPGSARNWNDLGCAFQELGRLEDALRCFERALAAEPDLPQALNNLGNTLRNTGDVERALETLQRVCAAVPDSADLASNYLFTLNLGARRTRAEVFAAHRDFDARFGSGRHGVPVCPSPDPDPQRRLRIAYFSPDLRSHPVSAFIAPVLAAHDRGRFEVSGYFLYPWEDAVSARLRGLCDRWVACASESDAAIAERLRQDRIDIVVDLAGHTGWNRLPVLALKPAPVIATWLGYLNTTGLRAVDYRITDAFSDPPGSEQYHSEKLVRLPEGHSCFEPPAFAVPVNPLPALERGGVRFGSFNKASKLTEDVLASWARLLQAVPGSTLLIAGVGEAQRGRIGAFLARHGAGPERIEYRGRLGLEQMLQTCHEVDIALDTYPYAGTTTAFNSLWMGVPTVTLAGDAPMSRSGGSVLAALGLPDWVAGSHDEYVRIAARKAADLPALARLRAGLRARLEQSALMNAGRFTRHLEQAYRSMWQAHCASVRGGTNE
jgi:predicted O-linked N-acetylglucosamine transferase (SPINDLY family)